MYLIIVITISALLYKVIMRDQAGRVKQSVTLQARRVNIIIINDDHNQSTSTDNKTEGRATQQHVCQEEESGDDEVAEQRADINDIVRNRIMGLLMHRHLINRLRESRDNDEEGEYEESDNETVVGHDEVDPPAYEMLSRKRTAAQMMMSNKGSTTMLFTNVATCIDNLYFHSVMS